MQYNFFAFLSRMKYIGRWGLMRNNRTENVAEHSHQVAILANCLALIEKIIFKNDKIDPNLATSIAVYHETAEVITGDLPTPIKYCNKQINAAYKDIERSAEEKLIAKLPLEFRGEIGTLVHPGNTNESACVRYADKLAAFIKCIEERAGGNTEFDDAYREIEIKLKSYNDRSVNYFMENFIGAYYETLDKISEL